MQHSEQLARAVALQGAGRSAEAEPLFRALLAAEHEPKRSTFNLAWALLAQGKYAEGLDLWENARFVSGTTPTTKPRLSFPEWQGQAVKSLLVLPEQGFGDQIQYARFIPTLVARGIDVSLLVRPDLVDLFSDLGARVIAATDETALTRHDAWVMIGSLPHRLGVRLEALSGAPYLRPPQGPRPPLPAGARIGVVWRGGVSHANDPNRSLTDDAAQALLALPGAMSLDPQDTGARTFADTAAIISGLSLVVSIDTSVAHLAGAMGAPTWILLPKVFSDWRWMHDRNDSPWYTSVRLYRQPVVGDWTSAIEAVRRDLAGLDVAPADTHGTAPEI